MKKIIIIIPTLIVFTIIVAIICSPYQFCEKKNKKIVVSTIKINAPVELVYKFLGDSENAQYWSSYVDHISNLNDSVIPDGHVGSTRRCFQLNNEASGNIWDEEILAVTENKNRTLSIFNMQNFLVTSNHLITEQTYKELDNKTCELSFILYLNNDASWIDQLSLALFAYNVEDAFTKNIENVKLICEKSIGDNI